MFANRTIRFSNRRSNMNPNNIHGEEPIALHAYFGGGSHHPYLRRTTVHDWPLNVFRGTSERDGL